MVILRTLGECVIEIGTQRIGPTAPHLFGALLYLGLERGRAVPRATLQTLLFPDTTEARGAHSLRQLVYKLRGHGAPVATGREGISLAASDVQDDFTAFLAPSTAERPDVHRAGGTFLPGYVPRWSRPFAEWVEGERDRVHARMRRTLLTELAEHRRLGRWEAAERTARACLAIDPLNEEATLALAEALAVAGSKVKAVRLLDDYIAEAGPGAEAIKLPATLLRRRIAERLPAMEYDASRAPFVGRAEEMAELNALFAEVRRETSRTAVVWGDAGIGKTRLVAEFCKAAALNGATVLRAVSQPHDVRRPMGAFLDLAPQLLKLPGALGTSPDAMRYLQRLVTFDPQLDQPITAEMRDPEYLAACITRALSELLDAVTSEAPLIVVIEDAQWLDRVSTLVLGDLLAERRERRLLLVGTWRAAEDPMPGLPFPERSRSIRLGGLRTTDAETLLLAQFRELAVSPGPELMAWAIRTAQGNPFFLHELARHYAVQRVVGSVPPSLQQLIEARVNGLDSITKQLLVASSTLGGLSTLPRLERMLAVSRQEFRLALDHLQSQGLVEFRESVLQVSHPLVSEHVLRGVGAPLKALTHLHAAEVLEAEVWQDSPSVALACAQHWLACDQTTEAIRTIRRAGRHLAAVGLAAHAVSLLQDVIHRGTSDRVLREFGHELLELAESCGEWQQAVDICDAMQAASQFDGAMDSHELAIRRCVAAWRLTGGTAVNADTLRALLARGCPDSLRADAVLAQISQAELTRRPELAVEAFDLIRTDLDDGHASASTYVAGMAFEFAFGDPQKGLEHLRSALAQAQHAHAAIRLRIQRNCAVALYRIGDQQRAKSMALDLYHAASRIGLRSMAFAGVIMLCTSARESDAWSDLRDWIARAEAIASPAMRSTSINLKIETCQLAIHDRRFADARAEIDELRRLSSDSGTLMASEFADALEILLARALHTVPDQWTAERLKRAAERSQGRAENDLLMQAARLLDEVGPT